jgi:hypothetical protein
MCVEKEKRLRFFVQMFEQGKQHNVLVDIGKIAGMKGVAIVHGEKGESVWVSESCSACRQYWLQAQPE